MNRALLAVALLAASSGDLTAQTNAADAGKYAAMLKSDKDADHRLRAAEQLASIGTLKAAYLRPHTTLLVEAFKTDKDSAVRAAAGRALLVYDADPKEVTPAVLEVFGNSKEVGAVLAVGARLAATYKVADAVPALTALKEREEAKDDPKLRDQKLLQAVNQALRILDR